MDIDDIWDKYIKKLLGVNDELVSEAEHNRRNRALTAWREGVQDTRPDIWLNGDYHYIQLFDSGEMKERPMCCGVFLDWKEVGK